MKLNDLLHKLLTICPKPPQNLNDDQAASFLSSIFINLEKVDEIRSVMGWKLLKDGEEYRSYSVVMLGALISAMISTGLEMGISKEDIQKLVEKAFTCVKYEEIDIKNKETDENLH